MRLYFLKGISYALFITLAISACGESEEDAVNPASSVMTELSKVSMEELVSHLLT